jgi:hypothetical protein
MTRVPENTEKSFPSFISKRNLLDADPYDRVRPHTLSDLRDNVRLKGFLKRAVEKDFASGTLINSIRLGIRR